jgi:outer membrane protein assembly factor BamB
MYPTLANYYKFFKDIIAEKYEYSKGEILKTFKERKNATAKLAFKKTTAFALFLMLTITLSFIILPSANAETKQKSWAYVAVNPDTVGMGQYILVTCWTSPIPTGTANQNKTGYVLTFTKPDASTQNVTLSPSYLDGTQFTSYKPDAIGTWTVTLYWPGNALYDACLSPAYKFNVTETAVYSSLPEIPLRSDYWTRPVAGDLRNVAQHLASWPGPAYGYDMSFFNPYSYGPTSSHVLWSYPVYDGGILGGVFDNYDGPDNYAARCDESIPVIAGRAYVQLINNVYCIDLSTGELEWVNNFNNNEVFFNYQPSTDDVPVYRGVWPVIYEASTGSVKVYYAKNAEPFVMYDYAGGSVTDPRVGITAIHKGYIYYTGQGYLLKWNPNIIGDNLNATSYRTDYQPTPKLTYRVPIPAGVPAPSYFWEDIGVSSHARSAFNLTTGEVLWNKSGTNITVLGDSISRDDSNLHEGGVAVGYGKFFQQDSVHGVTVAYDLYTGEVAWVSEQRGMPYGVFTAYQNGVGNEFHYVQSYDGYLYAYNVDNGSIAWKFYSGNSGLETPYNTWPWWGNPVSADGKVYASTGEHSATNPQLKGNRMYCIDQNGNEIWSIAGAYGGKSIADDTLLAFQGNTGNLLAFARGQTAMTISVSDKVLNAGSRVLIEGTITDQSPAQPGTPCVSKDSMSAWMEYIHLTRPKPTNATGVPVTLSYVDPDGASHVITTVTSDLDGFRYEWTPPTSNGIYQIRATFDGDESYWPSYTTTAISVGSAPSAVVSPTSPASQPPSSAAPTATIPTSSAPTTSAEVSPTALPSAQPPATNNQSDVFLVTVVALVVVVAVVLAAAVILKKRK